MGNFHSSTARLLASPTRDEEEAACPNLQNQYKSNGDSFKILILIRRSIYKATTGLLQKLCLVFNYLRPRKAADPSFPIQNPAPSEPILVPTVEIDIVGQEWPAKNYSVPEIGCSKEIEVEISSSREEEREAEEQVKRSIVVVEKEKRIKHYSSRHRILLVGEGDFSFSACLAAAFGSAANMIATSLDSEAFLKKHYANAMSNIALLSSSGGVVMHGIDATKIGNHKFLRQRKFDRIVFNFPHAGFAPKMSTQDQLRRHRSLVSNFLMNAKEMLSEDGEIHISHKTNGFHAEFKLESIASSHGLTLAKAVKFKCAHYPGYNTKYGFGGDKNFNCNPSKTFKFALKTLPLS